MCNKRSSKTIMSKIQYENYTFNCDHLDSIVKKRLDYCMINLIWILNNNGIKTLGCCCGHKKYPMTIVHQSPNGKIWELMTGVEIKRKKRFYLKDKQGYYFIPETLSNPKTKVEGKDEN